MNQSTVLQQWSQARSSLAATLAPSTVAITLDRERVDRGRVDRGRARLCGFRWSEDLIVTAAEALQGSEDVTVFGADGEQRATVLAGDLATDVAVLRVPGGGGGAVVTQASAALEAGAGVAFAGRSRRGPSVSFGTVRLAGPAWSSRRGGSIDQRLEFEGHPESLVEGALVADFGGTAQAMLVAGPRGTLLGIPVATIGRVVSIVQHHGYLPRPYLGLRLQALWLDPATRARWGRSARSVAAVASVELDSPAQTAGLEPGDLLEAIDGVTMDNIEAVAARLARTDPGQLLTLRLRRGGQSQSVSIQVAEWRRPGA